MSEAQITYTATVFVRHSAACPDAKRGSDWRKCNCRKSLLLYNGANQKQEKVSAKTRSWEKAETQAREWLDSFDPEKIRLKQLEAELDRKQGKAVRIEQAVAGYLADMITRLGNNGTVSRARTLLGHVDADGTVKRNGKLFDWLDKQSPRPVLVSDITPAHVAGFRNSWKYPSDLTTFQSWCDTKTFFKFCRAQGWIPTSPAAELGYPKKARGSRTATFTDDQYDAIVAAAKGNERLHTFLELLRWSAMALVDAVLFDKKSVDDAGTLRYTRKKTGALATVPLPEHVQVLIRSLPAGQPFRDQGNQLPSNIQDWRKQLQELFKRAGIKTVQTDLGPRAPHPHQLRDTCAVWYLRHGMGLHGVAKILGHANPMITAKHYLPFVSELEKAHIAEARAVLAAAKPKAQARVLNIANR